MQTTSPAPSFPAAFAAMMGAITSVPLSNSMAAELLFPYLGPVTVVAMRVGFAAIILLILCRPWNRFITLTRNDIHCIMMYGFGLGLMNLTFYVAISRIPMGIAVSVEFIGPLMIALYGSRTRLDILWLLLVVCGLLLLLVIGNPHTERIDNFGLIMAFVAGIGWALYLIYGQRARHIRGSVVTSLGIGAAALVLLPMGLISTGTKMFEPHLFMFGLFVALFSTMVPFSLEIMALKTIPKQTYSILLSLEPALAALFGLIILHQYLTIIQWVAIFCIMLASGGSALTLHHTMRSQRVRNANPPSI